MENLSLNSLDWNKNTRYNIIKEYQGGVWVENNLFPKSIVTGKRQITLPKDVCDQFKIKNGDHVIFRTEAQKIILEVEHKKLTCLACNGTRKISDKECFVCRGAGDLEKYIVDDIHMLIGTISMYSRKYNISIKFEQQELDGEGLFRNEEFPIIKLESTTYESNDLEYVHDEIQKLIIKQFSPRSVENNELFCTPSDSILKTILDSLYTEEAKKEVTKWFRYDRALT
jgi:AbrB family looped-hinge helix DNA binding protein